MNQLLRLGCVLLLTAAAPAPRPVKDCLPPQLGAGGVLLVRYEYDELMQTIEGRPDELDGQLKVDYYRMHKAMLTELEKLFKRHNVAYRLVTPDQATADPPEGFVHLLSCRIACEGTEESAWCRGGMFFSNLITGAQFEPLGFEYKSIRMLDRYLEKNRSTATPPARTAFTDAP